MSFRSELGSAFGRDGGSAYERAAAAGRAYALDQVNGDFFKQWVFGQMTQASNMRPEDIAPGLDNKTVSKSKSAARELAKRILEDLWWDIKRDIDDDAVNAYLDAAHVPSEERRDRDVQRAFFSDLQNALKSEDVRGWLAEEILQPIAKDLAKRTRRGGRA